MDRVLSRRNSFSDQSHKVFTRGTFDYLENERGQNLFCKYWHLDDPTIEPKALVFISHGFSEHLGLYEHVGRTLAQNNILAFGHDHVGHGRSEGIRAYVESVDEYVNDLMDHCKIAKREYGNVPLFLLGHSMGGMVVLRAGLLYPGFFRGIVFQGPLIIPGPQLGPIDFRLSWWKTIPVGVVLRLMDWVDPEMILGGVAMNLITRDEDMKKMLKDDGLRWEGGCKVRLLRAFVNCLYDNLAQLRNLTTPFLTLHGDHDSLCNVLGSRLMIQESRSGDKSIIEFPGAVHNLYIEIREVREIALKRTCEWILQRSLK
ncbi:hypothetical protein TCAL_15175 [Tigriopus californicus]|uniref:Serine aminopeptidase S33 domain-containing protein n=1 Tax=Tigriopus californicus TaxID=6832 RepID=A0A553NFQ3_TIGCA|nr:monoglyceride lipase-like [Tigriopus californicus]TRY64199.1 hypothetical protein TCAL_15175 [Tigriopus californicus]